jgi:hypothetical protein
MPTHEIFEWAGSDAPQCLDVPGCEPDQCEDCAPRFLRILADGPIHLDPSVKQLFVAGRLVLEPATREVVRHELLYVPR